MGLSLAGDTFTRRRTSGETMRARQGNHTYTTSKSTPESWLQEPTSDMRVWASHGRS
jgi:hypothetical protein